MRVGLDTNILAYAVGVNDPDRQRRANRLISKLNPFEVVLPTQVLGELFNVLTRKAGHTRAQALEIVQGWAGLFEVRQTTAAIFSEALEAAAIQDLQIWDAVILATSSDAGCSILLSEDFQSGFSYRGVTVVNPFAADQHPLMKRLLATYPEGS